jgi:hypothetical protein
MSNIVNLGDREADPQVYAGPSDELMPIDVFRDDGGWYWKIRHPLMVSQVGPFPTAENAWDNMMMRPGDADKDPDEVIARADTVCLMGVPR